MRPLTTEEVDLAKALFGGPCRVILAAFAWEHGGRAFSQKAAKLTADRCGSNMTQMVRELDLFARQGLLEKSQGPLRNDPVSYGVRKEHPMWRPLIAIVDAFGLLDDDLPRP